MSMMSELVQRQRLAPKHEVLSLRFIELSMHQSHVSPDGVAPMRLAGLDHQIGHARQADGKFVKKFRLPYIKP